MEGDWRSVFTGKEERVRSRVRMRGRAGRESNQKEKGANVQKETRRRTEQEATNSGTFAEFVNDRH